MITKFTPQAFPLWVVNFDGHRLAELVIGWCLAEDGTLSPIATGLMGGVELVTGKWAVYAVLADAQSDADAGS